MASLSNNELNSHLIKKLFSIYLLHGNELLLIQEALDEIRKTARLKGFLEREVYQVLGSDFDWRSLINNVKTQSLFAEKKIIEIQLNSITKENNLILTKLIKESSQDNLLIIICPKLSKTEKQSEIFRTVEALGNTIQINEILDYQLSGWIIQRLVKQGQNLKSGEEGEKTLNLLISRVEGNLLATNQEIQKLDLLYPNGELSFEQVEKAVLNVSRYDPFKFSEIILSGNYFKAMKMLKNMQEADVQIIKIHWMISEDLRKLNQAKELLSQGQIMSMILRNLKIWGVKEKFFKNLVPKISKNQIIRLLLTAHNLDGVIKGIPDSKLPKEPWLALNKFIFDTMITFSRFKNS